MLALDKNPVLNLRGEIGTDRCLPSKLRGLDSEYSGLTGRRPTEAEAQIADAYRLDEDVARELLEDLEAGGLPDPAPDPAQLRERLVLGR